MRPISPPTDELDTVPDGAAPAGARGASVTAAGDRPRAEPSVLEPNVDAAATATPAAPGAPTPDIKRTGEALARPAGRSAGITVLAVLALLYTLYFAREFLVPIAFAALLNFLLSPAIRAMSRVGLRPPAGAAIVVGLLLALLGGGVYALAGPAQRWAAAVPATLSRVETKVQALVRPVNQIRRTAEQVERAAGSVAAPTAPGKPAEVVVRTTPGLASRVFGTTERLVVSLLEIIILLYFLLAGGDLFLQKFIKVMPQLGEKAKAVEIARAVEAAISAYLTTALLVNVAEGAIVTLIMWWIGLPNPPFWGALVVCLEFIPYLGAATMVGVLAIAGLTAFDNVGQALLAPLSFLLVNIVQANLVSPTLLGHRLTLNPVAIFVGLAFFFWIWGVPGAFLAVPLLATLKILCDNIAALAAVGEFLGRRDEDERRLLVRADEVAA